MRILVVVAAGSGERLGAVVPKALVELAGRPLVDHVLSRLGGEVDRIVVVAPDGHVEDMWVAIGGSDHPDVRVVVGGAPRSASVRAGLDAADAEQGDLVAVHDAARALTPATVLRATFDAVEAGAVAAAAGQPVVDTLKRVDGDVVVGTTSRTDLVAVQTPQTATAATWAIAHETHDHATDDLGLVEQAVDDGRLQGDVRIVPGSPLAMKITHRDDLDVATALTSVTS